MGTNHPCLLGERRSDGDSSSRQARLEALAGDLYLLDAVPRLPGGLIALLADDEVERRGPRTWTVYATVACPRTGEVWFSFGGYPRTSHGGWSAVPWPW